VFESLLQFFAHTEWSPQWATAATLVAVLIAAFVVRRVLLNLLARFFVALAARSPALEERKRIQTLARVLRHAASLTLIVVAVLVGLNTIGVSIAPILGAAGVAGVAIGFGAQSLVKDFFSGMFLLLENQIRVGDVVEIAGKTGVVEELTLRRIQLRSFDGAVHYVSNGLITTVTNFSTEFAYAVVDVSIAYKEDLDHVFDVMRATAADLKASEPFTKTVIGELEILGVDQWAESAVIVRCRMKTQPLQQWAARREYLKRLKRAFEDAGISIPFPHRLLVQDNAEPRTSPPAAAVPSSASKPA